MKNKDKLHSQNRKTCFLILMWRQIKTVWLDLSADTPMHCIFLTNHLISFWKSRKMLQCYRKWFDRLFEPFNILMTHEDIGQ